ncbi:MAG: hypothetical protein JWO84_262 [Parcubacteria group bacterium]|nr:hypothetical protein [Parcubacteria group bacterium]
MSNNYVRTILAIVLPLAVAATSILAIGYINDQQTLRMLANEPQTYVAQDAALRVIAGGKPTGFDNALPIETDTAPYLLFMNATGTAIAGSGLLHGAPPTLPQGVLDAAKKAGVNRITWQPEPGVRQALVILPAGTYFVVAGRSLAYTEEQESALTQRALIGWAVTMAAVVLLSIVSAYILRKRED